jgi:CRISPR-associated protein Csx1
MTTAVLQLLGDPRGYKTARYVIEGKEYREKFLALAVQRWLNGDAKIIFFVPDSLVVRIEEDVNEAFRLLKDKEKFRKRVVELLDGVEAEVLIIPSVGVYSGTYTARFEGSVENTIVFMFKELIKRKIIDDIYADVSTGLNIYTTAMLEALRKFATYSKLKRILQGGSGASLKLAFVPQVLTEDQVVKVELHRFEVQAFFSLPKLSLRDICTDGTVKSKIGRKYNKLFREISDHLNTLRMAFNAIKYNTPLVFYHSDIINLDLDVQMIEREFMNVVEELEALEEVVEHDDTIVVKRPVLISRNIVNTFFAISMLSSIIDFWRGLSEPELDSILKTFKGLYENLDLDVNSRFLERDVEGIKELVSGLEGEKLLLELEGSGKSKDPKRDFFAHSGFLREITLVRKCGDKIILRYAPESAKYIRSWLRDPR